MKPEISQALDSLLEEIHASADAKVLRSTFRQPVYSDRRQGPLIYQNRRQELSKLVFTKTCPLCKQVGRANLQHYLSRIPFLPDEDKQYFIKTRQIFGIDDTDQDDCPDNSVVYNCQELVDVQNNTTFHNYHVIPSSRVSTKQSPQMKVFYKHHPLQLTLDTGAELRASSYKVKLSECYLVPSDILSRSIPHPTEHCNDYDDFTNTSSPPDPPEPVSIPPTLTLPLQSTQIVEPLEMTPSCHHSNNINTSSGHDMPSVTMPDVSSSDVCSQSRPRR